MAPDYHLPVDLRNSTVSEDGTVVVPPSMHEVARAKQLARWEHCRSNIEGVCGPLSSASDELGCIDIEGSCSVTRVDTLPPEARESLIQQARKATEASASNSESPVDIGAAAMPDMPTADTSNSGSVPLDENVSPALAESISTSARQAELEASVGGLFSNRSQCMQASAST